MTALASLALRVGADRRHLVGGDGAPVLIHGDTAWSLITALTEHEIDAYLRDRRARGFNAIIVNLIEHKFNGPATRAGETPFATPPIGRRPTSATFPRRRRPPSRGCAGDTRVPGAHLPGLRGL